MINKIRLHQFSVAVALSLVTVTGFAGAGDVGNLPTLLRENLGIVAQIFQTIAIMMGLGLFIGGMFQLKRYGEMRTMMSTQMSISGPLMTLLSGIALLFLNTFIGTFLVSFWGAGADNPMSLNTSTSGWAQYIEPVIMLVRLVGVYAFMRGIVMAAKTGSHQGQQGTVGKVLVHLFAGILCVHIVGTINLIESFFGLSFSF